MTTIQFPTEFSALLRLLNDHDVRYLVVGGYAVTYHGYPRTTGDLDLWIEHTEENAGRVVKALRGFGFDVPEMAVSFLLEEVLGRSVELVTREALSPHLGPHILDDVEYVEIGAVA